MASKIFQDGKGNYSSTRVIGFIVIMYALLLCTGVIIIGYIESSPVMVSAAAAGTIFTTIAGPAMYYLFKNKEEELKKDEER